MKKIFGVLLSILCMCCIAIGLTGCKKDKHIHAFDKQVITDEYKATDATCTEAATYYYSCECGAKGASTFEIGEPLGHSYSTEWSMDGNYHWHIATCEHANETTVKEAHIASDWIIDVEATYEQAGHGHKECTVCKKVLATEELPQLTTSKITFNTLVIDDNNSAYIKVANAKTNYNFAEEISVSGNAEYFVALDVNGIYRSLTNVVPLTEGDNIFYVFEMLSGKIQNTYTITIRRRPIYTIYLEDAANYHGYYEYQTVEEDSLATEPQSPEKAGYTFGGWNYDFSKTVTSDIYVNAAWLANTDTKYRVEYYWQNIEDDNYMLYESFDLQGTTDTQVYAEQKNYEHFSLVTYDYNYGYESIFSGNINGNGSLVLKLYYTRDRYSVNINNNNERAGTVTNIYGTYKYGTELTLNTTTNLGYNFDGWYNGETLLSSESEYKFTVENNIALTLKWTIDEQMNIFYFDSTIDTCVINGVKDKEIGSVIIPDYVTSIGNNAFYGCSGLTSITIPDSVTSIGDEAFSYCHKLVEVINKSGLNITKDSSDNGDIAYYALNVKKDGTSDIVNKDGYLFYTYNNINYLLAFVGSNTDLTLPDDYNGQNYEIYEYAFGGCSGLTSVTIPDSVTSIGDRAFLSCSGLTSITIPDSVTSIGDGAFRGCSGLTSVTIGGSVASIGYYAFWDCSGLTSVTIPDSVTSIGDYAFLDCGRLINVTIPDSVTSIGYGAFAGCSGVESITVSSDNTKYHSSENCLIETESRKLILGCNNSVIPTDGSVTSIGDGAFRGCSGLTSITIPDSVTSIGDGAFSDCSGIESLVVTTGNKKYHSANNCIIETETKKLIVGCKTSIIPSDGSVTSIGDCAFDGCSGLTSVTIGGSVTSFGEWAFYNCSKLKNITYTGTIADWKNIAKGSWWNDNVSTDCIIHCTDGNIKLFN